MDLQGIDGHRKNKNKWEVLVNWDHTNATWEPLSEIRLADATTLANYAYDNELTTTLLVGSGPKPRLERTLKSLFVLPKSSGVK